MNTIVLATGNAGKVRELSAMLREMQPDMTVLGLKDFPEIGDIPETGTTFEENARIKALAVARATGLVAVFTDWRGPLPLVPLSTGAATGLSLAGRF